MATMEIEGTRVFNRHGRTIRRSKNLVGLRKHYRENPEHVVVKVRESEAYYHVSVFWPRAGHEAKTLWGDWRVLLDWLLARNSWSIERVTFDAPLYDRIEKTEPERFARFRKSGNLLTRHEYITAREAQRRSDAQWEAAKAARA